MENLRLKEVFEWFYKINQIPRGSGNEKAVSDFLVKFAKDRNLKVRQDNAYNVIIEKEATKGYENSKSVIIQGHMDMVCVKDDGIDHDFEKDPIDMYVEGDYLKARGTTLGGDDGIAVAYALAILDSNTIKHPKLNVLITTSEETTMEGANAIKVGDVEGDYLLNIDSEEEGIFLVSSAGGAETVITFKFNKENLNKQGILVKISGLEGGHSGMEINKDRANANVLSARILNGLRSKMDVQIEEINGGTKHNAIANMSIFKIYVSNIEEAEAIIKEYEKIFVHEYKNTDANLKIEVNRINIEHALKIEDSNKFIDFAISVPNGVFEYSKDIEGLVETSLNNAIILQKDNEIEYIISVRSASESKLNFVTQKLETLAKVCGADFEIENAYPGWEYESESKLREIVEETWNEMYPEKATFEAVHAGLECGVLKKVMPNTEMISFGPNMFDVHSPKERISISSTEKVFEFTKQLLENLK